MDTNKDTNQKPFNMEDFFTRSRANAGIKLDLTTPEGKATPHWLRIIGVDSDNFRVADAIARREALELAEEKDKLTLEQLQAKINERTLKLIAVLVVEWSFDRPCNPDEVLAFLKEAPQIAQEVNLLAGRRSLFFNASLTNSTLSPAPSLN